MHAMTEKDVTVVTLIKGKERYIFTYDNESCTDFLQQLGRYASSPDLSFSWYDAAMLSRKAREMETRRQSS